MNTINEVIFILWFAFKIALSIMTNVLKLA